MIKRIIDILLSLIGLILFSPLIILFILSIWLYDFHNPFYIPMRVGKNGKLFKMFKLRSMIVNADKSKVDSTSSNDSRITPIGKLVRAGKIDEIMQLVNVFIGDMSLVGPRPNVKRETDLYTNIEKKLLTIKPGITDFASIVFADEGSILEGKVDPDLSYNQLIRPWKSRLGIFYIDKNNFILDIKLIALTVLVIINRQKALECVSHLLKKLNAPDEYIDISKRQKELIPTPPPGMDQIVQARGN
jgi:lipopolysaccharide/colanic/teichoic acid biosynthesis glycosyltransferase